MRKRCPVCGSRRFITIGHVAQEWLVDEGGLCLEVLDDCVNIIHEAGDTDIWRCVQCGYHDAGKYFNVEE